MHTCVRKCALIAPHAHAHVYARGSDLKHAALALVLRDAVLSVGSSTISALRPTSIGLPRQEDYSRPRGTRLLCLHQPSRPHSRSTQPQVDRMFTSALGVVVSLKTGIHRRICSAARFSPSAPGPDANAK